jgi:hypothetical protein
MTLSDEEIKLINNVLDELHEYIEDMEQTAVERGKAEEFKAWLFEGNYFLDFCKQYRFGEDNAGLEFRFSIIFDMWINGPIWPVHYNPEWEKKIEKQ